MTFSAVGLPAGLTMDPNSGMITGSLPSYATYDLTVSASNPSGSAQQNLRIVVGDKISLTPAMGWNSWTVFNGAITDAKIRAQTAALISTGLANYGYSYMNLDAGWEGGRTATGQPIVGNANFPNMQALGDYIHSQNLKFGVYTLPEPYGYVNDAAGTAGVNIWPDAQTFANWGVDYVKYDGNPPDIVNIKHLSDALLASGRDIDLSISVAGGLKPSADNVALYNGWVQSLRVGADITDFYSNVLTDGVSLVQPWMGYSSPGHWNDPDSLLIGDVVGTGGHLHANGLTLLQQQSQMSIWAMDAAPLLIGSDMTQLSQAAAEYSDES